MTFDLWPMTCTLTPPARMFCAEFSLFEAFGMLLISSIDIVKDLVSFWTQVEQSSIINIWGGRCDPHNQLGGNFDLLVLMPSSQKYKLKALIRLQNTWPSYQFHSQGLSVQGGGKIKYPGNEVTQSFATCWIRIATIVKNIHCSSKHTDTCTCVGWVSCLTFSIIIWLMFVGDITSGLIG